MIGRSVTAVGVLAILLGTWCVLAREPAANEITATARRSVPAPTATVLPRIGPPPSRVSTPANHAVTVASCESGPAGDDDFCDRWYRDRRLRQLMHAGSTAPADSRVPAFITTFADSVGVCRSGVTVCTDVGRRALALAGFHDPQVRPVGDNDPVARSLWAVAARVGDACILGGWDPVGRRWSGVTEVLGRRRDTGRCLAV